MMPQLIDTLNFLSKLTGRKLVNALGIFVSYYVSRLLRRPIVWGLPFHISIEPTTSCNLRCPECPSGLRSFSRPTGMLANDLFRLIIDQSSQHLFSIYLYFQGEPYLHPHFFDMIKYASEKNIYTVTSTNAHFLSNINARKTVECGLDRIIISIDGTTQQTYQQYRIGGQLRKVIDGVRNLIYWRHELQKKNPYIILQFIVTKYNEHQITDMHRLARELHADKLVLKTAQIYDFHHGHPLIPDADNFSRYHKTADGLYHIKSHLPNRCWRIWHAAVITWDGRIVPCCFDKDASHQLGDLHIDTLKEIWNNTAYKQFRNRLLHDRKSIDICNNCTEGLRTQTA